MEFAYFFPLAYLCGSFPTSFLLGRLFYGINLFEHGSKNVGATNAFRVLGKKPGLFVLFFDALKGFAPVALALHLFPEKGSNILLVGLTAILGHSFSIFLKFRGGKGVATSAGVFAALLPKALSAALLIFAITLKLSSYVSAGSIMAAISFPVFAFLFYPEQKIACGFGILMAVFIIIRHRANISRIKSGTENKFVWRKKNVH
jgi:glycerol-3-phosphate acyltransferase PlsY